MRCLSRGYESSMENIVHFGLGKVDKIKKMTVNFPDGKSYTASNLAVNKVHTIVYADAKAGPMNNENKAGKFFTDISDSIFTFAHKEEVVDDFESEVLLPNKMSQLGPFITKGDVDGDGLEDVYISGASGQTGHLMLQSDNGFVEKKGPWSKDLDIEELGCEFLDVDNDGDLDLYVTSGGNEFGLNSKLYFDKLYINDGKGNFKNESVERLPPMVTSGQSIAFADYDNDGDLDIYVAGRQTPGYYPFAPRSYLLNNNGKGFFTDVTVPSTNQQQSKELASFMGPGMITDLLWDDIDGDKDLDLIVVGEWMAVTFFENNNGVFSDVTKKFNPSAEVGWWYSIAKGDFNGDGVNDYIVGNVGENNKFHPTDKKPLEIYCSDFDKNGTYDIVLAKYQNNICYPVRGRQCSSDQMPFIVNKFPSYADFATADLKTIYGEEALDNALHYSATNFSSVILVSDNGSFKSEKLPSFAQFGPINKSIILDLNNDGNLDVIAAGNNFSVEVETIKYDGSRGVVLLGNGNGDFDQLSPLQSGFFENQDMKDMELINIKNLGNVLITVNNRSRSKSFLLNK